MKLRRLSLWVMCLLLCTFSISPVGASPGNEASNKRSIVVTTSIIADVTAKIAGDKIKIIGLLERGQDPHGYQLTPKDMAAVEQADALFINGFDLEEHILGSLKNVATRMIVEVSAGIDPLELESSSNDNHNGHSIDPHTWMSPLNVMIWTDNIVSALTQLDPYNEEYYATNGKLYRGQLQDLHDESLKLLSNVPFEKRNLITDHDTLGYFARDYGCLVVGMVMPSVSTNSDISARHLSELIKTINDKGVSAIFVSSTISDETLALMEMIQEETTRPIKIVRILSGSLQPDGMPGQTYIDFMRFDVDQILHGLTWMP